MSGLFRRLAGDVVGAPAARLRPMSRLPYAPAPALDAAVALESGPPPLALDVRAPMSTANAPPRPPSAAAQAASVLADPDAATMPAPGASASVAKLEPAGHEGGSDPIEPPQSAHASPVLMPRAPGAPRAPHVVSAVPQHAEPVTSSGPQDFRPPAPLVAAADTERARGAASGEPARGAARALTLQAPPLRLPSPAQAAEAPNEVHVHIGRVEVTAIREPVRQPRPARRGIEPLSLDQYLAKRGERRG